MFPIGTAIEYQTYRGIVRQGLVDQYVGECALVEPYDRYGTPLLDLASGDLVPLDFVTPAKVIALAADADAVRDAAFAAAAATADYVCQCGTSDAPVSVGYDRDGYDQECPRCWFQSIAPTR